MSSTPELRRKVSRKQVDLVATSAVHLKLTYKLDLESAEAECNISVKRT